MARFCTACGTRQEDEGAFCEECGKPLRPVAATLPQIPLPSGEGSPSTPMVPRRWIVPAAVGAAVLLVVVAGAAWWLAPPGPSASAFRSALQDASAASVTPSADLLCLSNLPYDRPQINVAQYDVTTRGWMDALTSAGLYTAQPVDGVYQQLVQYKPTAELATWRRGARLCAGKSWSVREVKGDSFAPEKHGTHTLYRATVVWQADGVAPWLSRVPAAQWSPDLKPDNGSLTTESNQIFEVRDRRWVALTNTELIRVQRDALQTAARGVNARVDKAAQGGVFSSLGNLFSGFGNAHPLVGEWAIDNTTAMGGFVGAAVPFKGGRITFGNDYMETGGERVKARFEVSGDVVTVAAEGETGSIRFRVKDKAHMAMDFGLAELPFTRVR